MPQSEQEASREQTSNRTESSKIPASKTTDTREGLLQDIKEKCDRKKKSKSVGRNTGKLFRDTSPNEEIKEDVKIEDFEDDQ